jgi:hypothetical protein
MGDGFIDRSESASIEGRIVHYDFGRETCRAAIIVRSWGGSSVNLHVFLDGSNDQSLIDPTSGGIVAQDGWLTSRLRGNRPGHYHDPRTCPHRKSQEDPE